MDREQAMTLLKQLLANDLVEPSHISIRERHPNDYQLQIRTKYKRAQLDEYCKANSCSIEEDIQETFLLVFKP